MANVVTWKVLKTVTGDTDETDYAGDQTAPDDDELLSVAAKAPNGLDQTTGVAVMVEMIDNDGVVQARGAGAFDLQFVWVAPRSTDHDDVGQESGTMIGDTAAKTAQVPYRPILTDFRGGPSTKVGVRLTNITLSAGATKYRVLIREL